MNKFARLLLGLSLFFFATAKADEISEIYDAIEAARAAKNWEKELAETERGIALNNPQHLNDFQLHKADLLIRRLGRGAEAMETLSELIHQNRSHVQGLGTLLPLTAFPNLGPKALSIEESHQLALQVLNLIEYPDDLGLREKFGKHHWLLLPPVAEYYALVGMPSLAVYYQKLALLNAVNESKREKLIGLQDTLGKYLSQIKSPATGLEKPDPLDVLLANNPINKMGRLALVDQMGQLPVEVLAAPDYLKNDSSMASAAVLWAVANNPEAPTRLRTGIIQVLGFRKVSAAVPMLKDFVASYLAGVMPDTGPTKRVYEILLENSLWALGELGDASAIQLVLRVAENDKVDWQFRTAAIKTLGQLKASQATNFLLGLIENDKSGALVDAAASALGEIGDPQALPTLQKLIHYSRETRVIVSAGSAAVKIGQGLRAKCENLLAAQAPVNP